MIKQIFYTGSSEEYTNKVRHGKSEKIKNIKVSSDVKEFQHLYTIWFDFITTGGKKVQSDKVEIDSTQLFDERGYISKEGVFRKFKEVLDGQLVKFD